MNKEKKDILSKCQSISIYKIYYFIQYEIHFKIDTHFRMERIHNKTWVAAVSIICFRIVWRSNVNF